MPVFWVMLLGAVAGVVLASAAVARYASSGRHLMGKVNKTKLFKLFVLPRWPASQEGVAAEKLQLHRMISLLLAINWYFWLLLVVDRWK